MAAARLNPKCQAFGMAEKRAAARARFERCFAPQPTSRLRDAQFNAIVGQPKSSISRFGQMPLKEGRHYQIGAAESAPSLSKPYPRLG